MEKFLYTYVQYRLTELTRNEEGGSLAEYTLLMSFIVVVCVAAVTLMGTNIRAKLFELAAGV